MSFTFLNQLPTPAQIKEEYPLSKELTELKAKRDAMISDVICGKDDRFLVIIKMCIRDSIKTYCVDNLLACICTYKRYTECKYQIDRVDMSAFFDGSLHIRARFFSKAFHAAYFIKMLGQMVYVRELFYKSLIYKF